MMLALFLRHLFAAQWLLLFSQQVIVVVHGFSPLAVSPFHKTAATPLHVLHASADNNNEQNEEQVDEQQVQWDLFQKHHAKGSWRGIWTTYDYIGDVLDETVASVNYLNQDNGAIQQTHSIVSGAKRSDCATCFDSMQVNEFPVRTYDYNNDPQKVFAKTRLGANAMVHGPSLLRSGVMATELVLAWEDGRVRVTFQHAPVWQDGVEPGSCPPQGLKLVRTLVAREALRDAPPTAETEASNPPTGDNPVFHRPVPPFNWHKKWAGTSWTWGPQTGNRGWAIEELEEEDSWQGIATVERWNLRLPGGIFMQAPRVITDMGAELCRLAWLPNDETLLRVEAGCLALQPMVLEEEDDTMVGFYPPSLASLRCDVLKKVGELDKIPGFMPGGDNELLKPQSEDEITKQANNADQQKVSASNNKEEDDKTSSSQRPTTGSSDELKNAAKAAEKVSAATKSAKDNKKAKAEPNDPRDILQL